MESSRNDSKDDLGVSMESGILSIIWEPSNLLVNWNRNLAGNLVFDIKLFSFILTNTLPT